MTVRQSDGARLLGRAAEEARLVRLVDRLHDEGGSLLITGDPGIGKTSLLQVLARSAHRAPAWLVTMAGTAAERHLPFAGLQRLVRPLANHLGALPERQRRSLLQACEGTAPEVEGPATFVLGLALLELVGTASRAQPLIVTVDDAHWLDTPTTEVLGFLGRRLSTEAAALVLASRQRPVPAALLDLPVLRLAPLSAGAAEDLVQIVAPGLPAELERQVVGQACGNPLALRELARIATSGQPPEPDGSWRLDERIERTFGARSATLPADTAVLLLAMAVADGGTFSDAATVASRVLDHDVDDATLEPARRAGLVTAEDAAFTHPLVRSAIVGAAASTLQSQVHRAWADQLAPAHAGRAAWHRSLAAEGPDEQVAQDLEQAADAAVGQGALPTAQRWMQAAADLSAPERRVDRLLRTGELAYRLGRPDDVHALATRLRSLRVTPAQSDRLLWLEGSFDDAAAAPMADVDALVAGAERASGRHEPDLALTLLDGAARRSWWNGIVSPSVSATAAAVSAFDDPRVLEVHAHASTLAHGGDILHALQAWTARPAPLHEDAARLTTAAFNLADFGHALHFARQATDGLREQGQVTGLAQMQVLITWAALFVGRWDLAYTAADEAYRLAVESRQPVWAAHARLGQADLEGRRGHTGRALELLADAERIAVSTGRATTLSGVEFVRGVIELGRQRPAEAYEHLRRSFDPTDRAYHPIERLWLLDHLSEAAVSAGRSDDVQPVVEEIGSIVQEVPSPGYHRNWRLARVHLAKDRDADERVQEARDVADGTTWPWYDARLDLAHGMVLRRQRRIADARHLLRRAQVTFDQLGAAGWTDRARGELAATGAPVTSSAPSAWQNLSPQELQIAQLAAEGLTNREIGSRLYLSHRTVGSHLYRVFPKLGVTSRHQLVQVLHQR